MEHTSPELASALMQWISTFKTSASASASAPLQSWNHLADGTIIWAILNDIDPAYFHANLPDIDLKSNDNWIPRWQNWKHIEKEVLQYIHDECDRLPNLGRRMNADLKAIATDSSVPDIQKVVKCVLLAAMFSDNSNERMVDVMGSLGPKVAQPIATFIAEIDQIDQAMVDYADTEPSSEPDYSSDTEPHRASSFDRDPELEREEKLIQALQEKKKVDEMLADALAELEETRQTLTLLQDELEESKYARDRRRSKSIDDKNIAQLSQRADQDRQYIEELETDLASAKATLDQQHRQLDRLKTDAASKQELRDELQLIAAERDDLRQKAKASENLRKKIQTLQEQEKSSQTLRHDLQQAHEQLQDIESLRDRCTALEKANEENAQTIANGEQEIFDQKTAKRMVEYELKTITQKWEQSKELLNNAQDTVRDLEDRLHDIHPSRDEEQAAGNLDDELNADLAVAEAGENEPRRKSVQPPVTADGIVLQQKLNIATAAVDRLEKRCLDLLQENLGFKATIDDASEAQSKELHPFQHQARRLEEITKDLDSAKSKYITASSHIADLQQRLESAQGKSVSSDIALQVNQERQRYITDLEQTLRDQRNLLRHALLSAEALQKEEAWLRATNEFKLIKHQLEIVNTTATSEAESVIKSAATSLTDRIESIRGTLAAKDKIMQEREADYANLQGQYEALKMRPPPVPPKDQLTDKELQKRVEQLQQENKLVASAWYDITSRLQSNTLHLARRAEGGRSWLSRMRTTVNATGDASGQGRRN